MYTILAAAALALVGPTSTAPTTKTGAAQVQTKNFKLWAFGDDIEHWAIVNAHAAAGTNAIQIQRPSIYTSDRSYLLETSKTIESGPNYLDFLLGDEVYGMVVEKPEEGGISQVYTQLGSGSKDFKISQAGVLGVEGSGPSGYMYEGFWACPVDDVFTLWYGVEPVEANMPNADCVSIMLETEKTLF